MKIQNKSITANPNTANPSTLSVVTFSENAAKPSTVKPSTNLFRKLESRANYKIQEYT